MITSQDYITALLTMYVKDDAVINKICMDSKFTQWVVNNRDYISNQGKLGGIWQFSDKDIADMNYVDEISMSKEDRELIEYFHKTYGVPEIKKWKKNQTFHRDGNLQKMEDEVYGGLIKIKIKSRFGMQQNIIGLKVMQQIKF